MKTKTLITLAVAFALGGFLAQSSTAEEGDRQRVPKNLLGFSGQVRGVVVKKGDRHFTFHVARVLRVWKNNKASNPKNLAGKTVVVSPRWVKSEKGKWHPFELHAAFIHKLRTKQEITLELRDNGEAFELLELSQEQRKWAVARVADRREGDRREGDRREGEGRRREGDRREGEGRRREGDRREGEVRRREGERSEGDRREGDRREGEVRRREGERREGDRREGDRERGERSEKRRELSRDQQLIQLIRQLHAEVVKLRREVNELKERTAKDRK